MIAYLYNMDINYFPEKIFQGRVYFFDRGFFIVYGLKVSIYEVSVILKSY